MKRVARCHELVRLEGCHTAVAAGDVSSVVQILGTGALVDEQDSFGNTPLHRAAWQGDADMTGVLLRHGADVEARRSDGKTALDLVELQVKCWGANPPTGLSLENGGGDFSTVAGILREAQRNCMTEPGDLCFALNELSCSSIASKTTCASSADIDMVDRHLASKSTFASESDLLAEMQGHADDQAVSE